MSLANETKKVALDKLQQSLNNQVINKELYDEKLNEVKAEFEKS